MRFIKGNDLHVLRSYVVELAVPVGILISRLAAPSGELRGRRRAPSPEAVPAAPAPRGWTLPPPLPMLSYEYLQAFCRTGNSIAGQGAGMEEAHARSDLFGPSHDGQSSCFVHRLSWQFGALALFDRPEFISFHLLLHPLLEPSSY